MKIIFVDTYYPSFLKSFYKENTAKSWSYEKQKNKLLSYCFGTSDFFSFNFKKLGWQAEDLIVNDEDLQRKWASENNVSVNENKFIAKLKNLPYVYRIFGQPMWIQQITLEQIKKYKPDVVYCQNLSILNPGTLVKIKKYCKLLVGQIASPKPPKKYYEKYDLIITSFPHFVKEFRNMGINSEYQKLAFEPRVLEKIGRRKRIYDVTFIGSFTPYHKEGIISLEKVARKIPVNVWGQGLEFLSPTSPLRKNYHGEAWGLGMYKILSQSKIIVNRHISTAGNYANNMRLYESTGMGAMLITDRKKNLKDLFIPGSEVVEYKTSDDLIQKVNYYLNHENERKNIADRGQKRTLTDHAYPGRMKELSDILIKYINKND